MTSSCLGEALIFFCGIPLGAALLTRVAHGLTEKLAPAFLDDTPSMLRSVVIVAGVLVVAWVLQCQLGVPILRRGLCVCEQRADPFGDI